MDGSRENNAEDAMPSTARSVGEAAATAAHRVGEGIEQGREAFAEVQALMADRTRECIHSTEMYVRDNPWQSVGIAAGIGLVIGLLLGRR